MIEDEERSLTPFFPCHWEPGDLESDRGGKKRCQARRAKIERKRWQARRPEGQPKARLGKAKKGVRPEGPTSRDLGKKRCQARRADKPGFHFNGQKRCRPKKVSGQTAWWLFGLMLDGCG